MRIAVSGRYACAYIYEHRAQRVKRLEKNFSDPSTEVYLMFLQSVLPSFTHCNQFLQREEPLIHVLQPQLAKLVKNILAKFVQPAVLAKCLKEGGLSSVDFKNSKNHVSDEKLVIGFMTKQAINKLLRAGDISVHQHAVFLGQSKPSSFGLRSTFCSGALCKMSCFYMLRGLTLNKGWKRALIQ